MRAGLAPSASKAASHRRPGSRSPAFRKLYGFLGNGITCRTDDPVRMLEGQRAISKAKPKSRAISGSNPWPCRCCLIGMGAVNSTVRNLLEEYSTCMGLRRTPGARVVLSLAKGCLRKGLMVADALRRQGRLACPRCKNTLREVTRVPAPTERGWADRIRVPCLLLRDECDLAKAN